MAAGHARVTVQIECCCEREHQQLRIVPHFGVPRSTTAEQRTVRGSAHHCHHTRKVGAIMDLAVDKELPILAPTFKDELGNTVPAPADFTMDVTSDNPAAVFITVADDGVQVARSAGSLSDDGAGGGVGPANIHLVASWTDADGGEHTATGDAQLVVVAGGAERVEVNFGEPREITPDA